MFDRIAEDHFYGTPTFIDEFIRVLDKFYHGIPDRQRYIDRAIEEVEFLMRTHEE